MTNYKFTYFDMDGGRGEPIRIALHAAGITFEDDRISFAEFEEIRLSKRFNSVPVLEIDGQQISQSNALSRYVGKKANLYPEDATQALYCDEVLEAIEDVNHYLVQTFGLEGEQLKEARAELVDGWLTTYLRGLNELLARGGGEYFAGNQLSIADLKVFVQTRSLCAGFLDHIPTDLVEKVAPDLMGHQQRVDNHSVVVSYYGKRFS